MFTPEHKHFLTGEEFSAAELSALLDTADYFRKKRGKNLPRPLNGKTIALIFEKPSLRTRVSFTVGIQELGGQVLELTGNQKKDEEPEDSIRVLQGMVHGVMLRTFEHNTLERMATRATIPLINGLSDSHHPCQALADLLTLQQRFGSLKGLKLAYVGDGNNVLHSLLLMAPLMGVNVHYACPQGYEPEKAILARALERAKLGGAHIVAEKKPEQAVAQAHAVYTDVWASMGQEQESRERQKAFAAYQLNLELFSKALPNAIALHCLPMVRGQEITHEVIEHPRSALFQQAENRLHAQKALLMSLFTTATQKNTNPRNLEYSHVV